MYIYHNVSLSVEPKRRALQAAQDDLAATTALLQEAQAKLAAVQARIAALEAQFEEASGKKEALARQVRRLATAVTGGSAGDGDRWAGWVAV
jgi:dynein heavy chain